MPAQISGTYADVTMLNRAFNDQSPGYTVYTNQVAAAEPMGITAFAQRFGASYMAQSEDQLSTKLLGNLGVLPNAGLQTALKDYLLEVGKVNVGIVALQLGRVLSGLETATGDQAAYAAAAANWNDEVFASYTYSMNQGNTSSTWPPFDSELLGVTLILTAGDDRLSPTEPQAKYKTTELPDTLLARTAGSLSDTDVLDGGAGIDTLKALLGAGSMVKPVLKNIEKVFITAAAGAEFGAASSTGLTELWADAAGGDSTFSGVNLATTVGLSNSGAGYNLVVKFAGTESPSNSANIILADATGNDEVTVSGIETLNVTSTAGSGAATTVNQARITADAAEKLLITGGQGLTTTVVGAHVSVIDASALTGALGLRFATTGATAVAITGGVGGDTLTVDDASGAQVVIASGSGADAITIGAHNAHKITLGGGADTLHITGLAGAEAKDLDLSTAAALGLSALEVTDFVSGPDAIRLTASAATTKAEPTDAQLASIAASSSLLDAATLAATTAGASKAIAFRYGADTYILMNDAAVALGANDSLVKLTGVAALAEASWAVA